MRQIGRLQFARCALLLGFGALIARLVANGQMRYYVSPGLDGLMAVTAVLLMGMGGLELGRVVRGGVANRNEQGELDQAVTLGLVALPLVIGLVITPRALGSTALGGASVLSTVPAFASWAEPSGPPPEPRRPIADVPDLLDYLAQAGANGVGQHVRVRGIVARGTELASDEFVLLRYRIVHCVADAQPLGILVRGSSADGWASEQWVEIDGTLASAAHGSERLVSVNANQIVPSEEPNDPYLAAF